MPNGAVAPGKVWPSGPVPIIGSGRFLNITSRRSGDNLDMGVIADAEKVTDVGRIAALFTAALDELESIA